MAMNQVTDIVKSFFEDFERSSNTFESDLIAAQFSDSFMAADPSGNTQVVKKDEFIAGISKRQAFLQSVGFKSVQIRVLEEKQLDKHYMLVKTQAHMQLEKNSGMPIEITSNSTYILFTKDDSPKIVFYLTHEKLVEIMQEHGLLT